MPTSDAYESLIFVVGSFKPDSENPHNAMMHGVVRGGDLGVIENPVLIFASDRMDGNRLVQDLILGSVMFGVPKCEPGAVINLKGARFVNDDQIEIDGFRVITPTATAGIDLPEPPEGFVVDLSSLEAAGPTV